MSAEGPAPSWSALNDRRREIRDRWPTIWSLPVVDRSTRQAAARIRSGDRVLDVGGSRGGFGRRLPERVEYRVLDVDPAVEADFRAFSEVGPGSFDVVVSFETLEHLTLDQARDTLAGIVRALRPGGLLMLSTPNVHHPWSYLRSSTHVTPFCYDELGALLLAAGLRVEELTRCHHDAWLKGLARRLLYPLYRAVGVDWAKSILAVARR